MLWSWLHPFHRKPDVIVSTGGRAVELPEVGEVEIAIEVNCIGASCPRPQMLAMKAFNRLAPGEVMELVSDNASSVESLAALALVLNARHLATLHDEQAWRVYLGKDRDADESRAVG